MSELQVLKRFVLHGDKCHFRHVETKGKPNKKSKKGGAKGSVAILKQSIALGCVSQGSYPKNLFYVNKENWDQHTPSKSPKALGTQLKFGKEEVHREVLTQSVRLVRVVLARRNWRKDHMRRPRTMKDAPAKQRGNLAKNMYQLQNSDKTMFYAPIEDQETKK